MRVFTFGRVVYDGILSVDFFLFILKQHPFLIVDIVGLIPHYLKLLFSQSSEKALLNKFYNILLGECTTLELEHFKLEHIHKMDLVGFAIDKNDLIITTEPSFLINIFINRDEHKVICNEFDLHLGHFKGPFINSSNKSSLLKKLGLGKIKDLFIYSFREKGLMEMANNIYIYRDHKIIDFDSYTCILRDRILYNMGSFKLVSFFIVNFLVSILTFIVANVVNIYTNDMTISFLIAYVTWLLVTFGIMTMLILNERFSLTNLAKYTAGVLPNFLFQVILLILLYYIIAIPTVITFSLMCILSAPLLLFIIKFIKFQ